VDFANFNPFKPAVSNIQLGDPQALVSLTLYWSPSCSQCADFRRDIVEPLIKTYVDAGLAKLEFRETRFAPANWIDKNGAATESALLFVRCGAPTGAVYLQRKDAVLNARTSLAQAFAADAGLPALTEISAGLGMNDAALTACLADRDARTSMRASIPANEARLKELNSGTPHLDINGQAAPQGLELIALEINSLLTKAGRTPPGLVKPVKPLAPVRAADADPDAGGRSAAAMRVYACEGSTDTTSSMATMMGIPPKVIGQFRFTLRWPEGSANAIATDLSGNNIPIARGPNTVTRRGDKLQWRLTYGSTQFRNERPGTVTLDLKTNRLEGALSYTNTISGIASYEGYSGYCRRVRNE
jgi:hypothetical protein